MAMTDCRGFFPCASTEFQCILFGKKFQSLSYENLLVKLSNVENEQLTDYNQPVSNELKKLPIETDIPSPNNPPWNSGVAILMWAVSVALIVSVPTGGLILYLISRRVECTDSKKLTEQIT